MSLSPPRSNVCIAAAQNNHCTLVMRSSLITLAEEPLWLSRLGLKLPRAWSTGLAHQRRVWACASLLADPPLGPIDLQVFIMSMNRNLDYDEPQFRLCRCRPDADQNEAASLHDMTPAASLLGLIVLVTCHSWASSWLEQSSSSSFIFLAIHCSHLLCLPRPSCLSSSRCISRIFFVVLLRGCGRGLL